MESYELDQGNLERWIRVRCFFFVKHLVRHNHRVAIGFALNFTSSVVIKLTSFRFQN